MSKNGSRDNVSSSICVVGGSGAVSLSTFSTMRSSDDNPSVFSRLRAFSALPRALNRPTTVVSELVDSFMSCPFSTASVHIMRCKRGLGLVCSLKQSPRRGYSEHDAYDSAKREIDRARIEQNLKNVTRILFPLA